MVVAEFAFHALAVVAAPTAAVVAAVVPRFNKLVFVVAEFARPVAARLAPALRRSAPAYVAAPANSAAAAAAAAAAPAPEARPAALRGNPVGQRSMTA